MHSMDRSAEHFAHKVRNAFSFLADWGCCEIASSWTMVRYWKRSVEVDIYHGRLSYEVGGGITLARTRFALSEIVRAADPEAAEHYRNPVATTPEGIASGLAELAAVMQRYGLEFLSGDQNVAAGLEQLRKQWAAQYARDVLAAQLRPLAEDAFRRGDYDRAAKLFSRFRECLSPAETKKLSLAEVRRSGCSSSDLAEDF